MSQQTLSPLNALSLAGILNPLFPTDLRHTRTETDNALECRNIFLLGAQGKGKTTTTQSLALMLGRKYGITNTIFAIQIAGIDRLLSIPTKIAGKCWLLCAEDITLAKIPRTDINRFFQVRHLIQEYTGIREGMAVTVFNSHTFHGLEKNLRDTFDALIIKSVPTNPYDRGMLSRFFDRWMLKDFGKHWTIDKALVWTPECDPGVLVRVDEPPKGAIENTIVKRSILRQLFNR